MDPYAVENFPEALRVLVRLREKGHEAYFAGGYFRDRFLKRKPTDADVATSARPEQVRAIFPRTIPVGEQFGIIIVQLGKARVEVATFREDERYVDGRHPTGVRFSSAEADAKRRDFTINGVFWEPVEEKALDFVGGREDLARGVVRAIGDPDARFDEDKLRILRAPRFAARLGFAIEKATLEAAKRRAREVSLVSQERIRDEVEKMLLDRNRSHAVTLLVELGLAAVVLAEIDAGALAFGRSVLDELSYEAPRTLVWAGLLSGAGEAAADALLARLKSSNADREAVCALVRDAGLVRAPEKLRLADQKRLLLRRDAVPLIALARAQALATDKDLAGVTLALAKRGEFLEEKGPSALRSPPLITGNDLKALGLEPGPLFKEILELAENARLEGKAKDRESVLVLLKKQWPGLFDPPNRTG